MAVLLLLLPPLTGRAQTLAGADELQRVLPLFDVAGPQKANRNVGIFYFLWQGDVHSGTSEKYWDLNEIVSAHPEVLEDFDSPYWGTTASGRYYFWGKPLYGYYRGDDSWVHLRNLQLLADADVDFLVIDATNALIYPAQSEALMSAMDAVQAQGKKCPKIVYYTNTYSGRSMQQIYDTYYKDGAPHRHPQCWFYLDGKPLILGISKEVKGADYEQFFTFRESQWPIEPTKVNGWPWIEFVRPQYVYKNAKGVREIVNVSVCQHPQALAGMGGSAFYGDKGNWGRCFRNGTPGNPDTEIKYGYNFQEQWDFALSQDVPYIFITGWNEWIAGRWPSTDNNPEHSYFCDQASPEYSRDIEPSRTAGLNDNYYMQMTANIRRYKGTTPSPVMTQKTIRRMADWQQIIPVYIDYTGDTGHRNHPGAQSNPKTLYTNTTGRNDLHHLKVAYDRHNFFFYAQTAGPLSPQSGSNWMRLYLNTDRRYDTGWLGYDYRIDSGSKLLKFENETWMEVADIACSVTEQELMLTIPLKKLGLSAPRSIELKWSDNMQDDADPLDWYENGDVAPGGRFSLPVNLPYSKK
jgi:hypothetical protein